MFDCLYSSLASTRARIYTHSELAFPVDGVAFQHRGQAYRRPYVAFNMISSVDGKATTYHGELRGLSSPTDRQVMQHLRSQVDGILVGGGTLRVDPFIPTVPLELAEERTRFFPEHPQPLGIVVTNTGDLPMDHRFWDAGPDLRVVFLGMGVGSEREATLRARAQVIRLPHDPLTLQPNLAVMLDMLFRDLGVKRLLVEGGPSLNYSLMSEGWSDELFLTLSPHLVGGEKNSTVVAGAGYGMGAEELPHLKLRSLYRHVDELFLRYEIMEPPASSEAQQLSTYLL